MAAFVSSGQFFDLSPRNRLILAAMTPLLYLTSTFATSAAKAFVVENALTENKDRSDSVLDALNRFHPTGSLSDSFFPITRLPSARRGRAWRRKQPPC
jgi:hypothetical protein